MSSPSVDDLPAPPNGKKGWPWTAEDFKKTALLDDLDYQPIVSIVTPSFNQGVFLEETIRSVLLQGYPNLEYIVIDGGSSDKSEEVIKKYAPWMKYWVSEPDHGQSHAINKGFDRASGEIFGWLNSDDYFLPGAIGRMMTLRQKNPDCVAWVGACQDVGRSGERLRRRFPRVGDKKNFGNWSREGWIPQPSCLFDAKAFREVGKLHENLHFAMDVDLWMRLADRGKFASTNELVSCARMYEGIKTRRNIPMQQAELILANFRQGLPDVARERMANCMEFGLDAMSYRRLVRYFLKRTRFWAWQTFRWVCGR